jgi:uncharacterized membrane protein YhaH (DUF805 family)
MRWYVVALQKYATLSGRARRKEFWMFFLINLAIYVALLIVESLTRDVPSGHLGVLATVYSYSTLIPSIAVGVRRIHDAGHNGWWYICPFVNLVFLLRDGEHGENEYGPDPKLAYG